MDFSVVIKFLGWLLTVVTIIFTIKTVYEYIKGYLSEWKPGMHLSLISNYCNTMCEYSDEITGNEKPGSCKSRQTVYLDASIKNFGTKDVRLRDTDEYVFIKCGDKYRWLTVEETITNPRISYQAEIQDKNDVTFTWNLVKKGEKIRMKLIAECLDPTQDRVKEDFLETLQLGSMKANLFTARVDYLPQERNLAKTRYNWYFSLGLVSALFGFIMLISDIQISSQNSLSSRQGVIYSIQNNRQNMDTDGIIRYIDKTHINVIFDPLSDEGFIKRYTLPEFNKKYSILSIDSVLVPHNLFLQILGLILSLNGAIIIAINALRLWALGNKEREQKYWFWFFQGRNLHMFD